MLLGGDELGRTQRGNNNAYCQDNEISWFDWAHADQDLLEFTRRLIRLRAEQPVLRRRRFFSGEEIRGSGRKDIGWVLPDGIEVADAQWFDPRQRSLGMILNGDEIRDRDNRGLPIRGASLMVLLNGGDADVDWRIPAGWGESWEVVLDTALDPGVDADRRVCAAGDSLAMTSRSLVVLLRS
jgi:glycogen operon protein